MAERYYAGVDVGASATKVVILNEKKAVLSRDVRRSGHDFCTAAEEAFQAALAAIGLSSHHIRKAVSTGYGRRNVSFASETRTEIGCHAKACYHYFPRAITIVDIGGQDNKVIRLNATGRRIGFKMNRKCAAGTGAFLEEMANRLALPLEDLDRLAQEADGETSLGSYCTVFSATEVLEKIRTGTPVPHLVKGIFRSMVKRVVEMENLEGTVVATGGVIENNPIVVDLLSEEIGTRVLVPPHPQCAGAVGAALFALETDGSPS